MFGYTLLLLCVASVIVLGYIFWSGTRLKRNYVSFHEAQAAYEAAAFKPGTESNPIRQAVDMLLADVLDRNTLTADRLEKSRRGIAHLNDIETEIDDIKTKGDDVASLRAGLEDAARAVGTNRESARTLVDLAKRQAEIIADIRGLSYRADFYTDEVFERIIDDQGQLTDDHIRYLNDLIPQLEEQFNRRSNLYTELQENSDTMARIATELGYVE